MNILSFMKGADINEAVKECRANAKAILLDVREPSEYNAGHIPGAVNIPVGQVSSRAGELKDKNAPVYVYCLSGGRAGSAVSALKTLGFKDVRNIGGIKAYKGEVEKNKGRSF